MPKDKAKKLVKKFAKLEKRSRKLKETLNDIIDVLPRDNLKTSVDYIHTALTNITVVMTIEIDNLKKEGTDGPHK